VFLKGLPAIVPLCGTQAMRAGDISKKIPPCSAVVKYLGFAPQSPLQSANGLLKPKYLTTFI